MAARACGVAMEMTRQYLAGELSVLLERVQAVATSEAASRDAWSLRQAAETGPIQALGCVTVRALALTERLCWDSLNQGDTAAFTRQAAAGAALREFGVCADLLRGRLAQHSAPSYTSGRRARSWQTKTRTLRVRERRSPRRRSRCTGGRR